MPPPPQCPRCAAQLSPPGPWSSSWRCPQHGDVLPYAVFPRVGPEAVAHVLARAQVPVWMPWLGARGWVVSGVGCAGDERTGARATALACSGPGPLGGPADLLVVAEEPQVGLGARYAGLPGPDPPAGFDAAPSDAKVDAAGHPTPLWSLASDGGHAVFVGEAKGLWLWALVAPARAGLLMYEGLQLRDLRDGEPEGGLVYGSLSPLLSAEPPRPVR